MADKKTQEIWSNIVNTLEEKLQYAFLKQLEAVVDVKLDGATLTLLVTNDEAEDFFGADINQQRLIIISRGLLSLETIAVKRVNAEPLR